MRKVNVKSVCPVQKKKKKNSSLSDILQFQGGPKSQDPEAWIVLKKGRKQVETHTSCSGPVFCHQALALHSLAYQKQNLSEKDARVQSHHALIEC